MRWTGTEQARNYGLATVMSDAPLQRQIRIGQATIGLLGLDVALNHAMQDELSHREAVNQLFETIASQNYIPAGMRDEYRKALAREYSRLQNGQERQNESLTIRILGPGCVSCNNIQSLVFEIMSNMQIAADIFQIHDLDEIGRLGVVQTPALIINNKIVSKGRLPNRSEIEQWLSEAIATMQTRL